MPCGQRGSGLEAEHRAALEASMSKAKSVTAAILVIGDEILSGRTKDKNIGYIAEYLTGLGIDIKEVRVVPDDEPEIIAAKVSTRCTFARSITCRGGDLRMAVAMYWLSSRVTGETSCRAARMMFWREK